jgi:thiamine biosynthesis lipoprotein
MRHVFPTMGTVVSLVIEGTGDQDAVVLEVTGIFWRYDERFSLYSPTSELSRIASGALRLTDASAELTEVYAASLEWRSATRGAFTPHRPDGVLDLSGIVKSWAMEEAASRLNENPETPWCLNVGGDVVTGGEPAVPWVVGIVDPADRAKLLATVTLPKGRRAAATSGISERGEHIWLADATDSARIVQATVLADDIVTADVLATAIISGGGPFLDFATEHWSIDVLTVDVDGELRATPGMHRAIGLSRPTILVP